MPNTITKKDICSFSFSVQIEKVGLKREGEEERKCKKQGKLHPLTLQIQFS